MLGGCSSTYPRTQESTPHLTSPVRVVHTHRRPCKRPYARTSAQIKILWTVASRLFFCVPDWFTAPSAVIILMNDQKAACWFSERKRNKSEHVEEYPKTHLSQRQQCSFRTHVDLVWGTLGVIPRHGTECNANKKKRGQRLITRLVKPSAFPSIVCSSHSSLAWKDKLNRVPMRTEVDEGPWINSSSINLAITVMLTTNKSPTCYCQRTHGTNPISPYDFILPPCPWSRQCFLNTVQTKQTKHNSKKWQKLAFP